VKGVKVEVENLDRVQKVLLEYKDRFQSVMSTSCYEGAKFVQSYVLARIPRSEEYAGYRKALRIAKVTGLPAETPAWCAYIDIRLAGGRAVDPKRTSITVVAKKRRADSEKQPRRTPVSVLEKFGPWTYETIPYLPSKAEADVTFQRVTKVEADRIAKQNKRTRSLWTRALARAGRTNPDTPAKVKTSDANDSKMTDMERKAIDLEFGLGGGAPVPAWKIAAATFQRTQLGTIAQRDRVVQGALVEAEVERWRNYPPAREGTVPLSTVDKFLPFSEKIAK
jgi:hypothetical protein